MKNYLVVAVALSLMGCAVQPMKVAIYSRFDAESTRHALEPGPNMIRGSALIRQQGGGVVSCAGTQVGLFPETSYSDERMLALYGSSERGFRPVGYTVPKLVFENEPPEYKQLARKVVCDAQGNFSFDHVADGSYFVISAIVWKIGQYQMEGGGLMQRVEVRDGEVKDVVLAP